MNYEHLSHTGDGYKPLFFFLHPLNTSSSHVPAHFLDTPAGEASDPAEAALHRERNPDQRPPVPAARQAELEVTGERDRGAGSAAVWIKRSHNSACWCRRSSVSLWSVCPWLWRRWCTSDRCWWRRSWRSFSSTKTSTAPWRRERCLRMTGRYVAASDPFSSTRTYELYAFSF